METLKQILSPDFLLRNSVYTSVLIGFACPLVGVFLVLRRLVFMGVALPQISSTGVAVALSVPLWLGANPAAHSPHSEHTLAFVGFTLCLFMLWSKGYSPQWLGWPLFFMALLLPNLRGIIYAIILSIAKQRM